MISQIFIDRPKLAMVVSLFLVIAGAICLPNLPVAEYPEVAPPQIVVQANYTGASASVVQETVALPLESQINGLENLLYFSSTCDNAGMYEARIFFKPGTNPDMDLVNTQNAIKRAEPLLPSDVQRMGIQCSKRTGDILSMFSFQTDGSSMTVAELNNYVGTHVKDFINRVDGISFVNVLGASVYSMRIWVDPLRLAGLNLSTDEIAAAIQSQNIQAAAGNIGSEESNHFLEFKINVKGRLRTVEEFGDIVVRHDADGNLLRIRDIGTVELGAKEYNTAAMQNGEPAVMMMIFRNSDANAVATVNRARAELERMSKTFPKGVKYVIEYDPTLFIRETMREIAITLVSALALVVLITFLFLQDWRATLVPTLAIPVSLLATFPIMKAVDFSINTLTLFGLILVIGSLVDDAIVVVENCQAQLEREPGIDPKTAASRCMKQITGAIIATTLVTIACYAPLGFYSGMVGNIYKQFAVTMCVSLSFSTLVALTLSPAVCSLILRAPKPEAERGWFWRPINGLLHASRALYMKTVHLCVNRWYLTVIVYVLLLASIWFLFRTIPTSFLPTEDKGVVMCDLTLPSGATVERTKRSLEEFRLKVKDLPGVQSVMQVAGYGFLGGLGENCGFTIVKLAPWSQRTTAETSLMSMLGKVQGIGSTLADARVTCFTPPAIDGLGMTGGISYHICAENGTEPQALDEVAKKHALEVSSTPGFLYGMSTYNADTPQIYVDVDHQKAESLGLTSSRIYSTLQSQLASYYVNDFNILGDTFYVKVQSHREFRSTVDDLQDMMIANDSGQIVPLSSVATVRFEVGPRRIQRFNKMTAAEFNAQGVPGAPSGELIRKIEALELPADHHIEWSGLSLQEKQNEGQLWLLVGLAIVFAYLFLVGQYESWTMPFAVMLSVSFAILGAILGLKFWGESLSIYAQLGFIMLIGLTAKNAILMAEFSKQEREAGKPLKEAAFNGASLRYRAVLMTAWSFVFGVLPLVVATGAGAGSRRAIGITTFSGMVLATVVGLSFTPALYYICQGMREFFSTKARRAAQEAMRRATSKASLVVVLLAAGVALVAGCSTVRAAREVQGRTGSELLPGERTVSPAELGIVAGETLTITQLEVAAIYSSPAVLQARRKFELAKLGVEEMKSYYLPTLGGSAGVNQKTANKTDNEEHPCRSKLYFTGSLTFDWLLWDFGANAERIKQALADATAAEQGLLQAENKTVYDVRLAFSSLRRSQELLSVAECEVAQYAEHAAQTEERFNVGKGTDYDRLKAQVDLSSARLSATTASNKVDSCRTELNRCLGLTDDISFELDRRPNDHVYTNSLDELMALARQQEPNLAALRAQADSASHYVDETIAHLYPEVRLSLGADASHFAWPTIWNAFAKGMLNYDFYNAGRDVRAIKMAVEELQIARSKIAAYEQELYCNLRRAVLEAKRARDSLEVARHNEKLAADNLRNVNERFLAGKASSVDRTDAQVAHYDAQAAVVGALYDERDAQYAIAFLIGD